MYQSTHEARTDHLAWQRRFERKFESKPQYLIPLLQYVQSEEGYLPMEAVEAVAEFLHVPKAKVFGVASFYAQFHFEPRGRNIITVCRGTACHVRGSGPLLRDLERHLNVTAGGTTEDLSFTVETVACYGSCALAPVVVVNDVVHRQQTSNNLRTLVDQIREETPAPKTSAKAGAKAGSKTSAKAGSKTGAKAGSKTSAKAGPKASAKAGPKTGAKAGPKTSAKAGPKTSAKASAKAGSKTSAKAGPKTSAKAGPKTGAKAGAKAGPKTGAKAGPKTGGIARAGKKGTAS